MYLIEWRLAYNQHELSSLLQDHVCRAMNQVVAESVCDGSECAHAAWRDHHSQGHKRATRDRSSLRPDAVILRGEALYVLQRVWSFMRECARRPLTHDEMRLYTRAVHHLQYAHPEDRSSRAGDTDDEPRGFCLFHNWRHLF